LAPKIEIGIAVDIHKEQKPIPISTPMESGLDFSGAFFRRRYGRTLQNLK